MLKSPEFEQAEAHFARELRHADYCKAHPEDLIERPQSVMAKAIEPVAPRMFPERRACPSEIKQVIPAHVISECEAMDAKLRDEEQKAMARRFDSPRITAMGEL